MAVNQMVIEFPRPCTVPRADIQRGMILRYFQDGGSLTVLEAIDRFGCYALSQRCGELIRSGWPIVKAWEETSSGARIKRYSMAAAA